MMTLPRYRYGARFYDALSAERFVYRHGRERAISLLNLKPGDRVLVVGCGTGLDLALLAAAVGETGAVVGVDRSPDMLHQARRKVARSGWSNVHLVQADAADLTGVDGAFDAVLFTYSLAIIDNWRRAWERALTLCRPDARIAVVDTDLPPRSVLPFRPLARLALWTGGVDRHRQVWTAVTRELGDPGHEQLCRGHIHVAAGTRTRRRTTKGAR